MNGRVLILTALTREARSAARELKGNAQIHVIGIGARHLPAEPASLVILAGYGGALSPDLRVGDVVIDDPNGHVPGLPFRYGRILCSSKILATPAEKKDAFEQTGAVAVDMESDRVRQWATEKGAGYIGVRAITDAADQPLEPRLLAIVDEFGNPRAGQILRRAHLLPAMLELARATRQADAALTHAVATVVAAVEKE